MPFGEPLVVHMGFSVYKALHCHCYGSFYIASKYEGRSLYCSAVCILQQGLLSLQPQCVRMPPLNSNAGREPLMVA